MLIQSVASTGDRFYNIRHFNTTMGHFVTAGWVLCLDELMCPWLGLDSWHLNGMPHISKIVQKPKGVGLEFKCVAGGETKVMVFLEIVEDSGVMQTKKYYNDEFGNTKKSSIATTLRMLEQWFSSGHFVVGDSWFRKDVHGTYEAKSIFYCYCKDCPQRISKNPFSNKSI